mmetsp:Transcript_54294/g.172400  ORF Transcript_54294/g.172400 Transcript_54294/m.172400 type:complete len:248 (-) Transcript_54294:1246-1989(-)
MPTPLHTSPSATWILLTSEVQRPPGVCVSTRSRRTSIPAIGCGDCSTHITPSSGFFTPHTRLTVFTPAKVAGNSCYAKAYGSEECGEGAHFLQQGIWFQHKRSRAVVARRLIKANHTPERRAGGPHNKLGGRGKASQERRAGYLHPDLGHICKVIVVGHAARFRGGGARRRPRSNTHAHAPRTVRSDAPRGTSRKGAALQAVAAAGTRKAGPGRPRPCRLAPLPRPLPAGPPSAWKQQPCRPAAGGW